MAQALLMRDYIRKILYASGGGYFSRAGGPILQSKGFEINLLANRLAYERAVSLSYQHGAHAWLTPTEKFRPHYSWVMVERILRDGTEGRRRLYEVGGGNGTMALEVLRRLKEKNVPVLYTVLELSELLAERQRTVLRDFIEEGCCEVVTADATTWDGWADEKCHVIALEVMDNLPHDKVRSVDVFDASSGRYLKSEIQQCSIDSTNTLHWTALSDPLIISALEAFALDQILLQGSSPSSASFLHALFHNLTSLLTLTNNPTYPSSSSPSSTLTKVTSPDIWVPSALYNLLKTLSNHPNHTVTLCDFTHFPGCLPGVNAPAVQQLVRGHPILYDSVEDAPQGEIDVLFPTDFEALKVAYESLTRRIATTVSHRKFIEMYGQDIMNGCKCQDGYNPMLEEFGNAAVLTSAPV